MYGGGGSFEPIKNTAIEDEDPVKLAEFEARIDAGEKIEPHGPHVWLVTTGWTGGPAGGGGERMKLAYTRRMVSAILAGELNDVETTTEPFFNLNVPTHIEGVPDGVLNPRDTWSNPADYDAQAARLVEMFIENFKQFEAGVTDEIRAAGPSR